MSKHRGPQQHITLRTALNDLTSFRLNDVSIGLKNTLFVWVMVAAKMIFKGFSADQHPPSYTINLDRKCNTHGVWVDR